MSNNLVSLYPLTDRQVGQMEHGSNSVGMVASEMDRETNHVSHNLYESKEQRGLVEPLYSNPEFAMVPNNRMGHDKPSGGSMGLSSIWMSDQLVCEDTSMLNNRAGENMLFPVKRKAEAGPLSGNSIPQPLLLPNKRPGHTGTDVNSLGFLQSPRPQRSPVSAQYNVGFPSLPAHPSSNKKMVRNDSISGRSGLHRGQTTKRQTGTPESASKGRPESLESVRSKMRESLAGALALAFQNQDNVSNTVENPSDAAQASESNSTMGDHGPVPGSKEVHPSKESASPGKTGNGPFFSTEQALDESSGFDGQSFQEFQYSSGLPDEDVPFGDDFFVKDDLLQGHGLSWAFDFDVQMRDGEEDQNGEKPESLKDEDQVYRGEAAIMTPENLAFKIEAELFKLFGDVNKKYREKGRSLLFNLKDRNNPDLRERVMSGEISPEKLCSMSAEELASKELSQWRMAKAEELAQMVVLPDTEVDIRRLVRKTHKGEFQVEVEHDDAIAADVSGGASMLMQPQPKKEAEPHSPSEESNKDKEKVAGQESNSEEWDTVIIPTTGTDLMQGMMVDELKDAEFLPPIVSLDEFMESLNPEPPFDKLSKDAEQKSPISSFGESPKLLSKSRSSDQASESRNDVSFKKASNVRKREVGATTPRGSPAKLKSPPNSIPKVDYIWEGALKLNSSSSITVGGVHQSGERTSTKEWPSTLEIKGRVRLEAFEKFLQELPMSRTRAVMVLQFVLKNKSKNDCANLSEAIEAYSTDQRLGYIEPVRGMELYLCPPTSRITNILDRQMPKESSQTDEPSEKTYLIGVVIWRKAHASSSRTISPNTSSHHKHTSKRQPITASKRVQDSSSVETNAASRTSPPMVSKSQPQSKDKKDDEDDDIPPGFGPGTNTRAMKDDDDLPEYNFSGDLNPSTSVISSQNLHQSVKTVQRPVDQVRELIKRYGQSETSAVNSSSSVDDRNLGFEPWNDDDDDDIPEWRPGASHQSHNQRHPVAPGHHRLQVPVLPTNQQFATLAAQKSPTGRGQQPPGGRWVQPQPPGSLHSARWRHQ